jgi:hypothetical protein
MIVFRFEDRVNEAGQADLILAEDTSGVAHDTPDI